MKMFSKKLFSTLLAVTMIVSLLPLGGLHVSAATVANKTGDIVTFGSYPQTRITDIALRFALSRCKLSADNTVTYKDAKYKRVCFAQYTPEAWTTITVTAKDSNQDNNGYYKNKVYWFKYEPIKWRVLSNAKSELLLMADSILESREYNQSENPITWEKCSLRSWLNKDFYNTAFSTAEKVKIKTSYVVNNDNAKEGTQGGKNTKDKLFLLSYAQAKNAAYGFSPSEAVIDAPFQAKGTDYSKSRGLRVVETDATKAAGSWWLRSPGHRSNFAGCVEALGFIFADTTRTTTVGVRPTMILSLVSSIKLNATSLTWPVGKSGTFLVTLSPTNPFNKTVSWKSSNTSVATVSNAGRVTTKSIGKATITCMANDGTGKKATCIITVIPSPSQ